MSDMAIVLGGKQPSITTTAELTLNSITPNPVNSRYYNSTTGNTDLHLISREVYLGSPSVFMSATSSAIKLCHLYVLMKV